METPRECRRRAIIGFPPVSISPPSAPHRRALDAPGEGDRELLSERSRAALSRETTPSALSDRWARLEALIARQAMTSRPLPGSETTPVGTGGSPGAHRPIPSHYAREPTRGEGRFSTPSPLLRKRRFCRQPSNFPPLSCGFVFDGTRIMPSKATAPCRYHREGQNRRTAPPWRCNRTPCEVGRGRW